MKTKPKRLDKGDRCSRRVDMEPEPLWDAKYFYCALQRGHRGLCRKPEPKIHEFPAPAKTTKKTTKELKPGDVIRHNEKSWIVDSIELAPEDPRRPGQWFDVGMHPQQSRVFLVTPLVYDFEVYVE